MGIKFFSGDKVTAFFLHTQEKTIFLKKQASVGWYPT